MILAIGLFIENFRSLTSDSNNFCLKTDVNTDDVIIAFDYLIFSTSIWFRIRKIPFPWFIPVGFEIQISPAENKSEMKKWGAIFKVLTFVDFEEVLAIIFDVKTVSFRKEILIICNSENQRVSKQSFDEITRSITDIFFFAPYSLRDGTPVKRLEVRFWWSVTYC